MSLFGGNYRNLCLSLLVCGLAGCSLLRASEAPTSPFLPFPDQLEKMNERTPFNRSSVSDAAHFESLRKDYHKIFVRPVNLEYFEMRLKESAARREDYPDSVVEGRIEEAREMARYLGERFKIAIRDYPSHPLSIVDQPGPDTFVLELALVEIVPTKPALNVIGTVAGFFIPGGGVIKWAGKGSVAMEGIVRDGATNEVLIQFKDRRSDKAAAFTVKDFEEYSHVRQSIDDWAKQYAELSATAPDHKVHEADLFTLNPL